MSKTVLLSDDDENILDTARDILEASGYTVFTATTGAGTLAILQREACDLLIVDYNLADAKGADLAIQAKALHPSMPILLMTGEAQIDLGPAKTAIQSILMKPVNPGDLLALLKTLI